MSIPQRNLVRRACVVLALVVAPAVACLDLWPDRPGTFTKANFDRIHSGMTYDEVVGILGPTTLKAFRAGEPTERMVPFWCAWDGPMGQGWVRFDHSGAVRATGYGRKSLANQLRFWWSKATGRPAPF